MTALYTSETDSDRQARRAALGEALSREYISIAEVDLRTDTAILLKSDSDVEFVGKEIPWDLLVQRYAQRQAYSEDRDLVYGLTHDHLAAFLESGDDESSLELRCVLAGDQYVWIKVSITVLSLQEKKLLVTTRNIHRNRMLQRIVDMYVFQSMDYFILVDAKHDSYAVFSSNTKGTPVPVENGNSYSNEMCGFNAQYVVPNDLERVTANMQLSNVLAMLENADQYTFSTSSFTANKEHRRIRVQYQYYDRSMGLILLTRTDITQAFMDEQAKRRRLTAALRDAQHDSLTDIYNQKATAELICAALESHYWNQAAFLFIDVDNFKMANDTLGHQAGDRLLQYLAGSLNELSGGDGIAGRVGGDEFLLFLPLDTCKEEVEYYAERICRVFDTNPDGAVEDIPISCSVGISLYPHDGEDYKVLVQKADQALYTSKRYGKSKYYFYSEKQHDSK